jgi:hypothetical protein
MADDTLRSEYKRSDLGKGVRGKYLSAYTKGSNLVLLDRDVAAVFPTAEAVNHALHALMDAVPGVAGKRSVARKRQAG